MGVPPFYQGRRLGAPPSYQGVTVGGPTVLPGCNVWGPHRPTRVERLGAPSFYQGSGWGECIALLALKSTVYKLEFKYIFY